MPRYIVTEDRHFKVLEAIDFPKVDVIGLDAFLEWLKQCSQKITY